MSLRIQWSNLLAYEERFSNSFTSIGQIASLCSQWQSNKKRQELKFLTLFFYPFHVIHKKTLESANSRVCTRFTIIILLKTFLGKLFLPYVFDSWWKVSDLIITAITFKTKTFLEPCLLTSVTAITFAVWLNKITMNIWMYIHLWYNFFKNYTRKENISFTIR